MIVKRVSKYIINSNHKLYSFCDEQSFKAKNLRNLSNYYIRQCFILSSKEFVNREQRAFLKDINNAIYKFNLVKKELFYKKKPGKIEKKLAELEDFKSEASVKDFKKKLQKLEDSLEKLRESKYKAQKYICKDNGLFSYDFLNFYFSDYLKSKDNPYKQLAAQTAQQIMRNLFKDWKSFFVSIKDYNSNKSKYSGRPKLPKYKKKNGRCKLSFTNQSCKVRENSYLIFPMTDLVLTLGIDTDYLTLKEVRIVPMGSIYKIEAVWDKSIDIKAIVDTSKYIGIDLGLSNLATITNNIGLKPIIINGRPLKSVNQYYNKKLAKYKSEMPFRTISRYDKEKGICTINKEQMSYSAKIEKLMLKRNSKIEDYMHKASAYIIKYCIEHEIGNIVIGNNKSWKSQVNLGSKNNQNFVQVPFSKLIDMISYKAECYGIKVHIVEESYSSQASFLDLDDVPSFNDDKRNCENVFSGKRLTRGIYKTGNTIINADVNGSFNILRKFKNDMFSKESVENIKYIPQRVNIGGYCLKKKPA